MKTKKFFQVLLAALIVSSSIVAFAEGEIHTNLPIIIGGNSDPTPTPTTTPDPELWYPNFVFPNGDPGGTRSFDLYWENRYIEDVYPQEPYYDHYTLSDNGSVICSGTLLNPQEGYNPCDNEGGHIIWNTTYGLHTYAVFGEEPGRSGEAFYTTDVFWYSGNNFLEINGDEDGGIVNVTIEERFEPYIRFFLNQQGNNVIMPEGAVQYAPRMWYLDIYPEDSLSISFNWIKGTDPYYPPQMYFAVVGSPYNRLNEVAGQGYFTGNVYWPLGQ